MAEPERPSRQDLVVPPRHSNLPLMLGALVCAGTGFGLVWALGIGRSPGGVSSTFMPAAAAPDVSPPDVALSNAPPAELQPAPDRFPVVESSRSFESAPGEPGRFPLTRDNDIQPASGERGWRPQGTTPPASPAGERYPAQPATLETPETMRPLPPPVDGRTSQHAVPGRFPGPGPDGVRLASAEVPPPATRFSTAVQPAFSEDVVAPAPPTDDGGDPSAVAAAEPEDAALPPEPLETGADVDGDLQPPAPASLSPPAAAPLAAAVAPGGATPATQPSTEAPEPPPMPPATPPVAQAPPPAAAPPATAPGGFTSSDLEPPATFRPAPHAAAEPSTMPANGQFRPAAATSPFASAPPMGPAPVSRPAAPPAASSGPPVGGRAGDASGQGRPGPMQLEGLQTPQLAVEKRGPREIQVGKPVRYEILVRNVGTATAQDVTLRDAVPYGTSLIATTPPASPGGTAAPTDLIWALGTLPAGGEARVSMEVMPETEGEIGSVASVSFRTDASVRSRATKPDLRLQATETKPVRIGGDVQVALQISNPGTGVATGVVLEGVLPEGVAHRAGRELEFDVGQLQPGESRTINLVMASTGPGVHLARFTARADGRLEVETPVRMEVTAPTLELTAEMPSRRYLQRPATCVLAMINAGTAPARSIELAAQLPTGLKFVRANHAGWYEEKTHRVFWNLEELPPGETGTVELTVMPVDLGPQKIVAAARSSDGLSDQAAHTVEVEGLAALCFEVTDSEDPVEVGGLTEYIVRVGNQGTKAASGVRVTATLLGDLEPVEARGPGGHRIENLTVVFEPLAKLAPAEEAVFRVRVRGRREGDQRMQVQLVSDDHPAPITKEEITRVYADR